MTKYLIYASCIAVLGFLSGMVSGVHKINTRESNFFRTCLPDKPGVRVIVSLKDSEPVCEKHENLGYGISAN